MTRRRPTLAALAFGLLASTVALPTLAQSPAASIPATSPAATVPAGPTVTIVAQEYAFVGLPSSIPVGTALALQNDGQEVHELLIARRNDGVTESWDELIAMSEEDVMSKVTITGPLVAAPGQAGTTPDTGATTLIVTQEGDYIALCFVPQGMTAFPDASASPAPAQSFGPPHAFLGMRQEFTVTGAGSSPGPMPSPMPMGSPMPSPAASPAA